MVMAMAVLALASVPVLLVQSAKRRLSAAPAIGLTIVSSAYMRVCLSYRAVLERGRLHSGIGYDGMVMQTLSIHSSCPPMANELIVPSKVRLPMQ